MAMEYVHEQNIGFDFISIERSVQLCSVEYNGRDMYIFMSIDHVMTEIFIRPPANGHMETYY